MSSNVGIVVARETEVLEEKPDSFPLLSTHNTEYSGAQIRSPL